MLLVYQIFFWRASHGPCPLFSLHVFSNPFPRVESPVYSSSFSASISARVPATHQDTTRAPAQSLSWVRSLSGELPAALLPKEIPFEVLTAFSCQSIIRFNPRLEKGLIFLNVKDPYLDKEQ